MRRDVGMVVLAIGVTLVALAAAPYVVPEWRRVLAWTLVVIILATPVVQLVWRRRDAVQTAQDARAIEHLAQEVARLRLQVARSAAQLDVWAETWGDPPEVVKARLRALRESD